MKTLISALALIASVTSASAMANGELSPSDLHEARTIAPLSDFSNLSAAQANAIESVLYSGDSNTAALIRSILMQE